MFNCTNFQADSRIQENMMFSQDVVLPHNGKMWHLGLSDEVEHLHDDIVKGDCLNIGLGAVPCDILNGMLGTARSREYKIAAQQNYQKFPS